MAKKLAKPARREQLLDTALCVVAAEGTDALTLARLADAAGVTKPIAYEHFGTREGLLLALFKRFDDKTAARVMTDMKSNPATLEAVVTIVARAYVSCFVSAGPVFGSILDALSATHETGNFRLAWRDELAKAIGELVSPYVAPTKPVLIGILGAAETLSETAAHGLLSEAEAFTALKSVFMSAVSIR